jgi:hypothetical protein
LRTQADAGESGGELKKKLNTRSDGTVDAQVIKAAGRRRLKFGNQAWPSRKVELPRVGADVAFDQTAGGEDRSERRTITTMNIFRV